MKYIAYVRKSTDDKKNQIQSIPNQLKWVKETALRLNIDILETFIDKQSAKIPGRKGFNDMMKFVWKLKEPVGIITWKISRLSRNPTDEGMLRQAFIDGQIKHFYASDQQFAEGANQILMGVVFGANTQYSLDLSEDVKFGMKRKMELGYRPGSAPLGYLNDPRGLKGQRKIYKDSKRFNMIKEALKKLLTGTYSIESIRNELNTAGLRSKKGRKLSKPAAYRMFHNPFYAGYYFWKGKRYKGKHPVMISIADFEKAQSILNRKSKGLKIKHDFHYNGLITCGQCHYKITTDAKIKIIKSTSEKKQYVYLRCTKKNPVINCNQKHLRQENFESQLTSLLQEIQVPKCFVNWFFETLKNEEKEAQKNINRKKKQLTKKYNECKVLIENLIDNFNTLSISKEYYDETLERYEKRKDAIQQKIAKHEENEENWIERAKKDFHFAVALCEKFSKADKNQKREIIGRLGSNWILNDGKVVPELLPIYQLLIDRHNSIHKHFPLVEPGLNRSRMHKNLNKSIHSFDWSSLRDEVRTVYFGNLEEESG